MVSAEVEVITIVDGDGKRTDTLLDLVSVLFMGISPKQDGKLTPTDIESAIGAYRTLGHLDGCVALIAPRLQIESGIDIRGFSIDKHR